MIKIKGKFGRLITWDLIQYDAYEMQFHTHSDHSIKGKYYDLEVQVHFRATTSGYMSKLAVLSILYKVTPGAKNMFFDHDLNILDLPDQTEKKKTIKNDINLQHLFLDDEHDLFQPFSYYQYEGSLTTPPCQEETTWFVTSKAIPISYTTVEYIKDSLKTPNYTKGKGTVMINLSSVKNYPDNYRTVQNKNGRIVYYFKNDCKYKKLKKHPEGHYEKVLYQESRNFFVHGEDPSGIASAFLIPDTEAMKLRNKDLSNPFLRNTNTE